MQTKHDNSLTRSQKKIYDAIVSYLKNLYNSNSDLFILRPRENIKTIELKNILQDEYKYKFVEYLLNAERKGAKLYVRKPNHELKRVTLLNQFGNL
ncbi:MAG: hypothetical protein ACLFM2_04195 [Halothece sp.]